jgi:Nif-specific regulatory protein
MFLAMPEPVPGGDLDRIRRERDLYRRLLDLGTQTDVEPFLKEALALVVDATGARQGYLELHDDADGTPGQRWSIAHGFSSDEVEAVRTAVSQGIIGKALATGRSIVTPSALLDPRFRDRESVRLGRIEAVLCSPIGDDPPIGVLYLQGRQQSGPFIDADRATAETFARDLAPLADRLFARRRERAANDLTLPVRATLRADGVVGHSAALAALLRQVALIAPLDVTVLLTGDSGTGKSQLARLIHENSPRATHPFVELNCAALPEALIESELFGALRGAHSTATTSIQGKVAAAERGTLLLDEVGDLPPPAQAKLLQLIQSHQYYPLGAAKPVQADARVIAATNTDLQAAVKAHRFREDLFYRLQVLPLRVPSLAERREDVADLVGHFAQDACARHRLGRIELSRDALRAAESAEWPGNVRQLAHAIEAAVIRAAGEGALRVERRHLFPDDASPPGGEESNGITFQEATRRFQVQLLRETLEAMGWNVVETARRLDLARSHVYNLMRAFGLKRDRD